MPRHLLSKENLARFAAAASGRLRAEDGALRKAYVRHFIDRVEVDDREIRIKGPTAALAAGITGSGGSGAGGVPRFDREWWAHKDSNLGPAD